MNVTGIQLVCGDVSAAASPRLERWAEQERLPEQSALPGVLGVRRYVATAECLAARPPTLIEGLKEGRGALCEIVLLGGDVAAAEQASAELEQRLAHEGRAFAERTTAHRESFKLEAVFRKAGTKLSTAAVPHLGHGGIFLGIWEILDDSAEEKVVRWYDEFHLPDITACPGFTGAMRFRSLRRSTPPGGARFLDLWLTESDPTAAMKGIFTHGAWVGHPERLYPNADKVRRLLFVSTYVGQGAVGAGE